MQWFVVHVCSLSFTPFPPTRLSPRNEQICCVCLVIYRRRSLKASTPQSRGSKAWGDLRRRGRSLLDFSSRGERVLRGRTSRGTWRSMRVSPSLDSSTVYLPLRSLTRRGLSSLSPVQHFFQSQGERLGVGGGGRGVRGWVVRELGCRVCNRGS